MAVRIDPVLCPKTHRCPLLKLCPVGAIGQEGNGLPVIDDTLCIACGKCVKYCGMQAITLIKTGTGKN